MAITIGSSPGGRRRRRPTTTPSSSQDDEDQSSRDAGWTAERLQQASYKDLGSPAAVENRFYQYLLLSSTASSESAVVSCPRRSALRHLLRESSVTTRDYSITIDTFDLLHEDPILGHLLLRFPATLLPILENAVVKAQSDLLQQLRQSDDNDTDRGCGEDEDDSAPGTDRGADRANGTVDSMSVKGASMTRVHARLVHLPPYCFKTSLAEMQAGDVGKIVQVTGTVVRTSQVQMYESARTYRCEVGSNPKKRGCGRTFTVHADMEARNNALQVPTQCPLSVPCDGGEGGNSAGGSNAPSGATKRCPGAKLVAVENGSVHTDYQEIKIQEAASRLGVGHIPRSLLVKLQHDLVDVASPGDEVVVVGSLLAQWQQNQALVDGAECHVGMAMSAHSIRVVAEKASSAWKSSHHGGLAGEIDKFHKEFEAFWACDASRDRPIVARDFICKAVCPKLYGLQVIKLALLITLIGGVSSDAYEDDTDGAMDASGNPGRDAYECGDDDAGAPEEDAPEAFRVRINHGAAPGTQDGAAAAESSAFSAYYSESFTKHQQPPSKDRVKTRRRDQSHLLLVGDPGTGKSQILRFAAALCPRSVLTTGVGTTSAGLTCAAVREGSGKEFALEAGALVLADKGVCCIDEFGCIQDQDRTTIHEAMEQQTLSVAKAGIVCKLNCRATIIAVMNPKDCLYDNHASLSANTGLGTPLLSRFDLIFKLVDTSDAERDSNVTTYLLNRAIQGAGFDVDLPALDPSDPNPPDEEPWTMEKLRAYVSVVKERFQPAMGNDAATLLERHYEKCRSARGTTIPVTVRFLESLIRLSQSHARLMWRNTVDLDDAVAVVRIMECSAFAYGGFDGAVHDFGEVLYQDPMTVDFSNEADLDFLCFKYQILKRYGMLEYLDDESRRKAELELNIAARGGPGGWDAAQYAGVQDGWGDAPAATSFDSAFTAGQDVHFHPAHSQTMVPGGNPWTGGVTYDHYGRAHHLTQNQAKRRRGS
jgi:DNA replicative helicase MCM subunit Mcm2 (Cdc46/Mcm family)